MKLCKDCKHTYSNLEYCNHPRNFKTSPVDGTLIRKEMYLRWCQNQREQGTFWAWFFPACGIKGRWFEEKK